MNQIIDQLTLIGDFPGRGVPLRGAPASSRPGSGTGKKKRLPAALVILGVGALLWVGANAPVCARVNPHWRSVRGSYSMIVGSPMVDANGVKYYPVTSVYQGSQPQIVRVLEPTHPAPGKPHRILYVLPVDTGVDRLSSRWGDGLEELRLLDVPNRFNMTLIAPSFNYEPWYVDSDQDPARRMESYIVHDLVPFGDTFAKGGAPQRYLIGFSKSGTGALILILRNPQVFNGAAVWDSPAQMNSLSRFPGLSLSFGTQANLDRYNIPALVRDDGKSFGSRERLWISGDQAVFTKEMIQLHHQLMAASIPHIWEHSGARMHNWHSGWLNEAAMGLDAIATPGWRDRSAMPAAPGREQASDQRHGMEQLSQASRVPANAANR